MSERSEGATDVWRGAKPLRPLVLDAEGEAGSPPAQAKPRSRLGPSRCPLTSPCVVAMEHHSDVQGMRQSISSYSPAIPHVNRGRQNWVLIPRLLSALCF